jgi:hypothetical protein
MSLKRRACVDASEWHSLLSKATVTVSVPTTIVTTNHPAPTSCYNNDDTNDTLMIDDTPKRARHIFISVADTINLNNNMAYFTDPSSIATTASMTNTHALTDETLAMSTTNDTSSLSETETDVTVSETPLTLAPSITHSLRSSLAFASLLPHHPLSSSSLPSILSVSVGGTSSSSPPSPTLSSPITIANNGMSSLFSMSSLQSLTTLTAPSSSSPSISFNFQQLHQHQHHQHDHHQHERVRHRLSESERASASWTVLGANRSFRCPSSSVKLQQTQQKQQVCHSLPLICWTTCYVCYHVDSMIMIGCHAQTFKEPSRVNIRCIDQTVVSH